MDIDPWAAVSNAASAVLSQPQDTKVAQLQAAKRALQLFVTTTGDNGVAALCLAAADGDTDKLGELIRDPQMLEKLTEADSSGLFPLTYAVVFGNDTAATLLLSKSTEMLNTPDELFGYTPLIWAVYCDRKDIAVELLNYGADPKVKAKSGITAFDLLKPGTEMYDFFEEHGLMKEAEPVIPPLATADFYKSTAVFGGQDDELLDNIRLQTAGLNIHNDHDTGLYQDSDAFISSNSLLGDEFEFNKLLKNQYIIFSDYDIPAILDMIFNLNTKHAHKTTYPAAVVYQCVRYADHMKHNEILVENFLNLAFMKIRSETASKTGVTSHYSEGDIVLQSYWLSVVNFIFFYLCRDDEFFKRYPKVLQDLITTFQSLMIELANSIKFRLNGIVDDCLLNYTSIPDISQTLYKNDWNFFKKKHPSKSTYEEIYQMLYPPSVKEQMRPSPIKITQTFGALLYVLELHNTHPLVTQQTLSIVFYWLGCTLFNRIISTKKYLSRTKAIQLRLNISVVEDWARSNDRTPELPQTDKELLKLFPYTLLSDELVKTASLSGVAHYRGNVHDITDVAFYHTSLFSIVKVQMEPMFELLQWLQCLSHIQHEDEVVAMVKPFTKLTSGQLWRCMDKYRYEVDEEKVDKSVRRVIEIRAKKDKSPVPGMQYSSKDMMTLNQDLQFPVVLPTVLELVDEYGAGIGGVHKERAILFQPFLPVEILDAIEEIHEQKTMKKEQEDEAEVQRLNDDFETKINYGDEAGDEDEGEAVAEADGNLFKELQAPTSLVHREWGEENPW